jgi:hypothetical protein
MIILTYFPSQMSFAKFIPGSQELKKAAGKHPDGSTEERNHRSQQSLCGLMGYRRSKF